MVGLKCEVLPICEAECERVFSAMGLIITKQRKTMKPDLLDALITIKQLIKWFINIVFEKYYLSYFY